MSLCEYWNSRFTDTKSWLWRWWTPRRILAPVWHHSCLPRTVDCREQIINSLSLLLPRRARVQRGDGSNYKNRKSTRRRWKKRPSCLRITSIEPNVDKSDLKHQVQTSPSPHWSLYFIFSTSIYNYSLSKHTIFVLFWAKGGGVEKYFASKWAR